MAHARMEGAAMARNRAYTWMIVVAVVAALTLAAAWRGWRNAPAATPGPAPTRC